MSLNPRILIIGCGAAGYSAACKLLESGLSNIKILEAQNRIGGRINSVEFGNGMVDLGAQWCHGEENNIVYEMVKDLNLIDNSKSDFERYLFVDFNGSLLDSSTTEKLLEVFLDVFYDYDKMKLYKGSIGDFLIKNFEESIVLKYPEVNNKLIKQFLEFCHNLVNNINGSTDWFEVTAQGHAEYDECEGHHTINWKDKGYKILFSVLNKEIPDYSEKLAVDDKILFNKEVTKIIWDDSQNKSKSVMVKCLDRSAYEADHVILTIPLGALKESVNSLFVPELPKFKKNAIQGLSFGCINKIFLKFPKKWWPDDSVGFSLLWDEEDNENVLVEFPEGPKKDGLSWLTSIFGFYIVDYNPNVLLLFINNKFSREIEDVPDDVIMRGCTYLLKKFVGKHYDVSGPDSIIRSSWWNNKYFRGSYSYISEETEHLNATAADLAKPLSNGMLFAGEATHSSFYSTVHGAIETGFREADRIISLYSSLPPLVLKCNVAIVGAGISGLAAATTLLQAGCKDFLVLEAQDKPGGRIQTIKIANGYVDLGAQWLHGNRNALWKICHDNNLLASKSIFEGRGEFLREDSYKYNDFLVEKALFVIGHILENCEDFVDSTDAPESVGKYLEEKFGDYLKSNSLSDEEMRLYLELYDWAVRFHVIDNSCDNLYNVSAKYWGRYTCPTTNGQTHINFTKGHGSVVDYLINKFPKKVFLNHAVTNINWTDGPVKLTCQNSTTVEADAVIVTSSLGVLKSRASKMFTPNLPLEMTEIISAMGFGSIGKILLLFEEKWWNNEEGFQLVWSYNKPYEDDWCRYLTGFDLVFDQPNMLLGWIGGRGIELLEHVSDEEVGRKCAEILKMFTGNAKITNPVQVIRSNWGKNPWILGAYSNTTPKCDSKHSVPDLLQQPLRDKQQNIRILLAGEHTHRSHFSTTHGAFETGMRQAQLLLEEGVAHKLSN